MTIKQKQNLLAYLGYYVGSIDGEWGQMSKTATKAFQKDYGINADGICGSETQKALKHAVTYGMPEKQAESINWWDGIKYFKKDEFKCKCGGRYCNGYPAEMEEKLVRCADEVREHFGSTVIVSSGLRCETHNARVGGVKNSRHKYGKAMDFCVSGHSAASVLPYVQSLPGINYAYAIDSNYIHMDVV